MAQEKLIKAVWELTKPEDGHQASRYRKALVYLFSVPDVVWHRPPFYVPQSGGRKRLIVPAEEDLRLVQGILADWIVRNFPLGDDYCYLGSRGVLAAVKKHRRSNYALVVDLKGAFDHVTVEKIRYGLRSYLPKVDAEIIELVVNLLTYRGRAPQGCISTPYAYNLVVRTLDGELKELPEEFSLAAVTRYSDNTCLSSRESIDFAALESQVQKIVHKNGFEISWTRRFADEPIIYLGTKIWRGRLSLADEKCIEFGDRLEEAILSPTPEIYRHQVTGIFNWAHHICGKDIPDDLLVLLARYFGKAARTPKPLAEILARKKMREMF